VDTWEAEQVGLTTGSQEGRRAINSRNKVSLKLGQVDVEGAIKAEGRGD
jgi:hypothetical protein